MRILLLAAILLMQAPATQLSRVAGAVTGRIVKKDGKPSVGLRVTAMEAGVKGVSVLASISTTDNEGNYRLEGILPGRYYIAAGILDIPSYYPGVASASAATVLNVTAGNVLSHIDFTEVIPSSLSISGRVVQSKTGAPRQPLPLTQTPFSLSPAGANGGSVVVSPIQSTVTLTGTTLQAQPALQAAVSPDGTFRFDRVRPGTYSLRLPGNLPIPALTVEAREEDVTGLEIFIPVMASLKIVANLEGTTAKTPDFSVQFSGGSAAFTASVAPPFEARLPEDDYKLTVTVAPRYLLKSLVSDSKDLMTERLTLSGQATVAATFGMSPPTHLRGRVVTESGVRGPELIHAQGFEALEKYESKVGSDGAFEFPSVIPGSYRVSFTPDTAISTLSANPTIVVPREGLTDARVTANYLKEIRGRVTMENGTPPKSVIFLLGGQIGRATAGARTTLLGASATVELRADGTFQFALPEGDYRIGIDSSPDSYHVKSMNRILGEHPVVDLRIDRNDTALLDLLLVLTR